MSTKAERKITLTFSGDLNGSEEYEAADNNPSPAAVGSLKIAAGNATITVPTVATAGYDATAVTIIKPSDYTGVIKLKGVNGDTGVTLHPTDPDTISLTAGVASFVLNVTVDVTLRVIFT